MAPRATDLVLSLMTSLWFASILLFGAFAQSNGIATYYTPPYQPSACYGFEDEGVMMAAASEAIWKGGAACGQSYQVKCVSARNLGVPNPCRDDASVVVKTVDLCPANACRGTIDLSQEAFASISDPNAGDININYQQYLNQGLSSDTGRSCAAMTSHGNGTIPQIMKPHWSFASTPFEVLLP